MNISFIDTLAILWEANILLPLYLVLFLWTIGSTLGTYLLALAMISWLEREVTFKELLTAKIGFVRMPRVVPKGTPSNQYINKQFIIDNFIKRV